MTKKNFRLRVGDIVVLKKNANVITRPFFGDNKEMEKLAQSKEPLFITFTGVIYSQKNTFVKKVYMQYPLSVLIKGCRWTIDSIDHSKPIKRYNSVLGAYEYHWVINKTLTV